MMRFLLPACRVSLGFALGTLFGWGLGQHLQDLCAHDVIRPALNDPDLLASFLKTLPPTAHAMRLIANGAGMVLGFAVLNGIGRPSKSESLALAALFLLASVMNLFRAPHGMTLSLLTMATVFTSVGIGISMTGTSEP